MPQLHLIETADGAPVTRFADGTLGVAAPGIRLRAAFDMPGGGPAGGEGRLVLVEADGLPLRLHPDGVEAETAIPTVLALRMVGMPDRFQLRLGGGDGSLLGFRGGVLGVAGADGTGAGWFRLGRPATASAAPGSSAPDSSAPGASTDGNRPGILQRIPAGAGFDRAGLAAMLSQPDPALAPAVLALLPQLSAVDVRGAWAASVPSPARDALFDAVRAHSRAELGEFRSYTAMLLRELAERFDWSIGDKTYGIPKVEEIGRGRLSIGRYCSLADPRIVLGNHNIRTGTTYPFVDLWVEWPGTLPGMSDHVSRDVVIGNDVWIGVGAVILAGAVIGDGAVIGAGCVVRGTVPPYGICIGNPGTVVKQRFPPEVVARLLRVRWWDWPDATVSRFLPLLLDRDIEHFLDAAEAELGLPPLAASAAPTVAHATDVAAGVAPTPLRGLAKRLRHALSLVPDAGRSVSASGPASGPALGGASGPGPTAGPAIGQAAASIRR